MKQGILRLLHVYYVVTVECQAVFYLIVSLVRRNHSGIAVNQFSNAAASYTRVTLCFCISYHVK